MAAERKPIIFYSNAKGPNPQKIGFLLEELNIPHTTVQKVFGDGPTGVKHPEYLQNVSLNGRIPAIDDNGFIVWESGAILLYLAEKYAPDGIWHGRTIEERALVNQWLTFQLSGLGPMLGQFVYFKRSFDKPVSDDVIDRYVNETHRIFGVLEQQLERQEKAGSSFIALDRITIADLAFTPWVGLAQVVGISLEKYPRLQAYQESIQAREKTKNALARMFNSETEH